MKRQSAKTVAAFVASTVVWLGVWNARAGDLSVMGNVTVASNLTAQTLTLGNALEGQALTVLAADGSTNFMVSSSLEPWEGGAYCWRTVQANGSFANISAVAGGVFIGTTGLNTPGPVLGPGDIWIASGDSAYWGSSVGNVSITAGSGVVQQEDGGWLLLQSGQGVHNARTAHGGNLMIRSGEGSGLDGYGGFGGDILIEPGPGTAGDSNTGRGGSVFIQPRTYEWSSLTGNFYAQNFQTVALTARSNMTLVATNSITLNASNLTVNALAVYLVGLPTSTNGLTTGRLWSDSGTLKVIP